MQSEISSVDAGLVPSSRGGSRFVTGSPVKHILAPTDLGAQSRESVACAVRLARGFRAKLTLLHVRPGSDRADLPFTPLYAGQLELDARRILEESQKAERNLRVMRDRIRVHHALTEDCFLLGDPAPLILWVARECHVDLLVIGASHYNWLGSLFAGPNSDKILRDAPCPVLVVPGPERERLAPESDSSPLKAKRPTVDLAWAKE
ncbi:MAG: universal stress protein [Verrucomicrobia bacterium]|nr:universal stress protein [Verrucomicrobiota bacterium]MBV8273888.1 universal stress protein [Verrucomicrobiota bacterium]